MCTERPLQGSWGGRETAVHNGVLTEVVGAYARIIAEADLYIYILYGKKSKDFYDKLMRGKDGITGVICKQMRKRKSPFEGKYLQGTPLENMIP